MSNSTIQEINESSEKCFNIFEFFKSHVTDKWKSNKGFAGYTHALSGLAASLLIIAFIPDFVAFAGLSTTAIIVAFVIAFIGATLVPDLDNTSSTSRNSLGFLGVALSNVFRITSQIIQTVVRLPKDDSTPNPHRGFYHTTLSAILIGLGVWGLTSIETPLKEGQGELLDKTWGDLISVTLLFLLTHLTFSALGKTYFKKIKKNFFAGEIVAFGISLAVAVALFMLLPADGNYLWLITAIALGCFVHILGDGFTRYGVPIFFPLPIKGRLWWYFRFAKLESGGEFEKTVIPVIFILLSLVGLGKIIYELMN